MNAHAEQLAVLGDLGYNEREARFLYLVAIHSGYFTLGQFLDFTHTAKGWAVHQFTTKSIRLGHLRAAVYGHRTAVFNLFSRKVYGALDRDNLRNRRRLSNELIRMRLLILDFVLAHPELEYLETECDKVTHFRDRMGVPEGLIPGRVYKGINHNSTTKRCLVDRFPVFLSRNPDRAIEAHVPVFVYCDSGTRGLLHYITHLRSYEDFLRRLPGFQFIYAAPSAAKFARAERFFRSLFEDRGENSAQSVARYFRHRKLWEENKHSLLTRADRDLLRFGRERYGDRFYESAYRKWVDAGSDDEALDALLGTHRSDPKWVFRTHLLPRDYDIFAEQSGLKDRTNSSRDRSASRSATYPEGERAKNF
jgi:hypothetical protein